MDAPPNAFSEAGLSPLLKKKKKVKCKFSNPYTEALTFRLLHCFRESTRGVCRRTHKIYILNEAMDESVNFLF